MSLRWRCACPAIGSTQSSPANAGSRPTRRSGWADTSEPRRSSGSTCRRATIWRPPGTSWRRESSARYALASEQPEKRAAGGEPSQIYLLILVTLHIPAWTVAQVREYRVDAGLRFRLTRFERGLTVLLRHRVKLGD